MIDCNPGVFSKEVSTRIPTSIDLLDPESPLLRAIDLLEVNPDVKLHSVIGDYCWRIGFGRSDLVVPVESAREPAAVSELVIKARHKNVNKEPVVVRELLCILRKHAANHPGFLIDSSRTHEHRERAPSTVGSVLSALNVYPPTLEPPVVIMQHLAERTRLNAHESLPSQNEQHVIPSSLQGSLEVGFRPKTSLQSVAQGSSEKPQSVPKGQRSAPRIQSRPRQLSSTRVDPVLEMEHQVSDSDVGSGSQ